MIVYKRNNFTKEDFEIIKEMLQNEKLNSEYKIALLSLLRAYCKDLYCSDCQGSKRTSSSGGKCLWNQNMHVMLPLNCGPLTFRPTDCPIRKLLNK